MIDERLPDGSAAPSEDIENTWRETDFDRELAERDRRERRLTRRLENHRVARGERRRDLPRREEERKIPGHDRRNNAERLAQRVDELLPSDRNGLALDLVSPAGEVLKAVGRGRDFDLARLHDRLAVVERLQASDFVSLLTKSLAQRPDQAPALSGGHLAPRAAERGPCSGDGRVDVRRGRGRDLGDRLFGGRVDDRGRDAA